MKFLVDELPTCATECPLSEVDKSDMHRKCKLNHQECSMGQKDFNCPFLRKFSASYDKRRVTETVWQCKHVELD